jgi:hypothetical protein
VKKISLFLSFFICSYNIKAQISLYKPWYREHQSNIISLGVCSPAGECSVRYWMTLFADGTFSYACFNNQGCYGFFDKSQGIFEVKDSIFTLQSTIPDSVMNQKNININLPLNAPKFTDMTGVKLIIRKRKLYMIFPNKKEDGFLLLVPIPIKSK